MIAGDGTVVALRLMMLLRLVLLLLLPLRAILIL